MCSLTDCCPFPPSDNACLAVWEVRRSVYFGYESMREAFCSLQLVSWCDKKMHRGTSDRPPKPAGCSKYPNPTCRWHQCHVSPEPENIPENRQQSNYSLLISFSSCKISSPTRSPAIIRSSCSPVFWWCAACGDKAISKLAEGGECDIR